MSGHTPGPWVFMDDWAEVVRAEGADTICEVHENPGGDPRADGRLIAAAPLLLEVLRAIANELQEAVDTPSHSGEDDIDYWLDWATTAIAAATGEGGGA